MTVEEVRDDLAGADLANDSWLVYRPAEGAALVAFAAVEPRADEEFRGQVSVHPEWRRRSSSALAPPARASGPQTPDAMRRPDPHPGVRQGRLDSRTSGPRAWATPGPSAASGGCGSTSSQRRQAGVAEGITVRDFVPSPEDERAMYDLEAAFADHWGHVRGPTRTSSTAGGAATGRKIALAHGPGRRHRGRRGQ